MIPLPTILLRLSKDEGLFEKLSYNSLGHFFEIIFWYMPWIITTAPHHQQGLPDLAHNIRDVITLSMSLSCDKINLLWAVTGDLLLAQYEDSQNGPKQPTVDDSLGRTAPLFGLGVWQCVSHAGLSLMLCRRGGHDCTCALLCQ